VSEDGPLRLEGTDDEKILHWSLAYLLVLCPVQNNRDARLLVLVSLSTLIYLATIIFVVSSTTKKIK
jgi:hypothetical protein